MDIFAFLDLLLERFHDSPHSSISKEEQQRLDSFIYELRKNQRLNKVDSHGDSILHRLFELPTPPIETIKIILKEAPETLNFPNQAGLYPIDILWHAEAFSLKSNRPLKVLLYPFLKNEQAKQMLDRQVNISLGKRRHVSDDNDDDFDEEYHFDFVSTLEQKSLLKTPSLICFSGRGAYTPKVANGFAKCIRNALFMNMTETPKVQFLSAWYPGNNTDLGMDVYSFHSPYIDADDDSPIFYVKRFVDRYLVPLLTDEKGNPLSAEQSAKNMRMVNLLGYSYGGAIIQMIANTLTDKMKQMEYTPDEVGYIQSQICSFTIGADIESNNYKNHFQTYHLIHRNDETVFDRIRPIFNEKESEKSYLLTHAINCPNQKIMCVDSIPDSENNGSHNLNTYLNPECPEKVNQFLILWTNFVIINALNNSVQNANSVSLKPLSEQLWQLPKEIDFVSDTDEAQLLQNLNAIRKQIDYDKLVQEATNTVKAHHRNPFEVGLKEKVLQM